MPKDPNEIGALWMKSSSKGDYMTGLINGESIVCFRNSSDNPKAPQWRVLKSKPKSAASGREMHDANAPAVDDFGF